MQQCDAGAALIPGRIRRGDHPACCRSFLLKRMGFGSETRCGKAFTRARICGHCFLLIPCSPFSSGLWLVGPPLEWYNIRGGRSGGRSQLVLTSGDDRVIKLARPSSEIGRNRQGMSVCTSRWRVPR